jgi:hypothetical protein
MSVLQKQNSIIFEKQESKRDAAPAPTAQALIVFNNMYEL